MNDKLEKLIKREEEVKERFSKVQKAVDAVRQISKTDRHFIEFPIMVKILEKKADHLKSMQMKVWEKIAKEQKKCKHVHPDGSDAHTIYMGHGHNWSYYNCVYCNHRDER
jgi:methionine salvage enolase-phosphatase E1